MEALLVDTRRTPAIRFTPDHPEPRPTSGEVLLRIRAAGICATDLELARGYLGFRGVPGHEFVGVVVRGPAGWRGRRVVADINCPCGRCDQCRAGRPTHCRRRTVVGILGRDGAFAELLRVPAANCHRLPARISDAQAVFVEPLAAAVHALDELPRGRDVRIAVVGAGRLGLLIVAVLGLRGYRPDVIGRSAARLGLAERFGGRPRHVADVKPARQQDAVIECSGSPDGLRLALQLVRPRGTIILKSTYARPEAVDLAPLVIDELRVIGSRCGAFPPAIRLLATGKIAVERLITAEFPLARGVEAFAAAARPGHIKVLLRPGGR